jgi:hypothetical protein
MTPRFRALLASAFNTDINSSESAQAIASIRSLIEAYGFDTLVRPPRERRESVVYRDRVIYRDGQPDLGSEARITLNVPPDYSHSVIERTFNIAKKNAVDITVLSCSTSNNKTNGLMVLKLRLLGSASDLRVVDSRFTQLISTINEQSRFNLGKPDATLKVQHLKPNWFQRTFLGKKS